MDIPKATALLKQIQQLATDALALLAPDPVPVPTPAPAPAPVKAGRVPDSITGAVLGLDYTYHEGSYNKLPDFTKEKVVAPGTVTQPTLSIRKRDEGWAARFSGYYLAAADGDYTFFTASDDGSRLLIGNQVVVSNDAIQGTTEKSGKITLQKGYHAIAIEYYNYGGPQELVVSHTPPGGAKQIIPASCYFRVPVAAKPAATVSNPTATLTNG